MLATPLDNVLLQIQLVSLPVLARMRIDRSEQSAPALNLIGRATLLVSTGAVGILFVFAPQIVPLIFGRRWIPAIGAVRVCLIGVIPASAAGVLSSAIDSAGRPRARLASAMIAAVASVAALPPLALGFGVTGAAIASAVVSPAIDCAILAYLIRPSAFRWFRNIALTVVGSGGASLLLSHYVTGLSSLLGLLVAATAVTLGVMWCTDTDMIRTTVGFLRRPS